MSTPLTAASNPVSFAPPETVVAKWTIEDREVRLVRNENTLAFSVHADGREIKRGQVPLKRYDIHYALNLVTLFHKVIGENLKKGAVTPEAFLPVMCSDALRLHNRQVTPATDLKVALFGRINLFNNEVVDARFGVFNPSSQNLDVIELDPCEETTKQFLLGVPEYDAPHNNPIHHYEFSTYAKPFRPVIVCAPSGKIQSVALKQISALNRDVFIDENRWASTLVSAQTNSGFCLMPKSAELGHAMIIYEGIEQGKRVAECAHITTLPEYPMPNRKPNEAQVEFRTRFPSHSLNGPTWSLPKARVQEMVRKIRDSQDHFVKFSIPGTLAADLYEKWQEAERAGAFFRANKYSFLYTVTSMTLIAKYLGDIPVKDVLSGCQNCRDWCRETLESAGIHLKVPATVVAPNTTIRYINSHPEAVVIESTVDR